MFKLICFATLLAVARGGFLGTPATYSYAAAPASLEIHAPAIGGSQQNVVRSLDGNSAVSHYSKAVDTAFSSVRKYDTRVTNDAKYLSYAAAPAYTYGYAQAAPALSYASPAAPIVKAAPTYSYPAYSYAQVAPAAPIVKAAPAYSYPAYSYAPAAPIVKAAPAYSYPAYSYAPAAPIVKSAPAVIAHTTFTGLGASYAF